LYSPPWFLKFDEPPPLRAISQLPTTNEINPADLFRYTTNLVRTFTTTGDNAYFSPDGTNLLARYNMDPGGDYGDWWSVNYLPGDMPANMDFHREGNTKEKVMGMPSLKAFGVTTLLHTATPIPTQFSKTVSESVEK
jgi:hypothetical protein